MLTKKVWKRTLKSSFKLISKQNVKKVWERGSRPTTHLPAGRMQLADVAKCRLGLPPMRVDLELTPGGNALKFANSF